MFFPHLIQNIGPNDRVLEIGPGGTPHPRSDVFLEKRFSLEEHKGQRGYAPPLKTKKPIVYYDGGVFPFKDKEFDYAICSHVLEHIDDVPGFIHELTRIAAKGYIEFPTIYYDYIYNFPEHVTCLLYNNRTVYYLPKKETIIQQAGPIARLFYRSLEMGHDHFVRDLKSYFFQGFEWSGTINVRKAQSLDDLTFNNDQINIQPSSKQKLIKFLKP